MKIITPYICLSVNLMKRSYLLWNQLLKSQSLLKVLEDIQYLFDVIRYIFIDRFSTAYQSYITFPKRSQILSSIFP